MKIGDYSDCTQQYYHINKIQIIIKTAILLKKLSND